MPHHAGNTKRKKNKNHAPMHSGATHRQKTPRKGKKNAA